MASIKEALTFPMESGDWIKTIIIGTVLMIFSFLIIPAILVYGYIISVIRESAEGAREPPGFKDWGTLLVEGIQSWIIGIIYMIIPIIVGVVTVGGSIAALASGTRGGVAAGTGGILGGLIISVILSIIFGYIALAAIINFAKKRNFGAGFEFGTIKEVITSGKYAVAWITSVVILIVASIIVGILSIIPILGQIIGILIFFYTYIVAAKLWADGYTSALS